MAYNGWSNYETWNVKLWMDNEEGSYRYWNDEAHRIAEDNSKEDATRILADQLKDEHQNNAPDLGASVWADLLGAALSEVDWYEIASALLEDCEFAEKEDEG